MKNGKYILVKAPDTYLGKKYRGKYCYEHHLVWWKNTKELIKKGYLIHHKNKNTHDNNFENLEKLKVEAHKKLHGDERKIIKKGICPKCNQEFIQKKRPIQKFCSRRCIGLYNYPKKYSLVAQW